MARRGTKPPRLLLKIKMGAKDGETGEERTHFVDALWGVEENIILTLLHGGLGNIAEIRQTGISAWSWSMAEYT